MIWFSVWAFWLFATRGFHPTFPLALITTTSLILAYAGEYYLNQFFLVPKFFHKGSMAKYVCLLLASMASLTGLALLIIRMSYTEIIGPDPDHLGAPKHFAIDLFGMAVHLGAASLIQMAAKSFSEKR